MADITGTNIVVDDDGGKPDSIIAEVLQTLPLQKTSQ